MNTGLWIFLCVLSFVIGEITGMFLTALFSANKEDDYDDKQ